MKNNQHASLALCIFVSLAPSSTFAASTLPLWYNQADVLHTRQGHLFGTNDLTPTPDINSNANGTAQTIVNLGQFADGWQEPNTIQQSGVDVDPDPNNRTGDGAWDLGIAGSIETGINFAPSTPQPGMFYDVEFQIYAVAFSSLQRLPEFEAVGLSSQDLSYSQETVEGPLVLNATWEGMMWTGTFKNVDSSSLTIRFNVPTDVNSTSIIDSYEVFTRYTLVPEPSASAMLLGSLLVLISRRRRAQCSVSMVL